MNAVLVFMALVCFLMWVAGIIVFAGSNRFDIVLLCWAFPAGYGAGHAISNFFDGVK